MKNLFILMTAMFLVHWASGQSSVLQSLPDHFMQVKHSVKDLQPPLSYYSGNEQRIKEITDQHSLIQLLDSTYVWLWDTVAENWQINSKITDFVYDANYNLTHEGYKKWNGSNWENYWNILYTYDSNNNQTSYFRQNWVGSEWVNYSRYIYTYDSSNNQTGKLYQRWTNNSWGNYSLLTFSYDSNDNQTIALLQTWNSTAWENVSQDLYTYDMNDDRISAVQGGNCGEYI